MQVVLQITSGPQAGVRSILRDGQQVRIGRTEWADVCVAGDSELADIHFAVRCEAGGCFVEDLSGATTALNGEPIQQATRLSGGDRITAGSTEFVVQMDAEAPPERDEPPADEAADTATAAAPTAAELCQDISLDDETEAELSDEQTPRQFVECLIEKGLHAGAVSVLARMLTKREAVWWACVCIDEVYDDALNDAQNAAVKAARTWATNDTDENALAAEGLAEAADTGTAAGTAALATFFAGASLAPPDSPEPVPPPDDATAQVAAASVSLTAMQAEPADWPERYERCLQLGLSVADGDNRWDESE